MKCFLTSWTRKLRASSPFNEILLTQIRSLLRKDPTSIRGSLNDLLAIAKWNTSLVDQVSDALVGAPPTEENIRDLYYWGRFLFNQMKDLNEGTEVERFYGLAQVTDFVFKYISRPTKIPFRYWEDIAPHLLGEVRRFRSQTKSFREFYKQDLDTEPLSRKDKWLASNPETAAMYDRWDHENMFG